jgi:hypothetical protein
MRDERFKPRQGSRLGEPSTSVPIRADIEQNRRLPLMALLGPRELSALSPQSGAYGPRGAHRPTSRTKAFLPVRLSLS